MRKLPILKAGLWWLVLLRKYKPDKVFITHLSFNFTAEFPWYLSSPTLTISLCTCSTRPWFGRKEIKVHSTERDPQKKGLITKCTSTSIAKSLPSWGWSRKGTTKRKVNSSPNTNTAPKLQVHNHQEQELIARYNFLPVKKYAQQCGMWEHGFHIAVSHLYQSKSHDLNQVPRTCSKWHRSAHMRSICHHQKIFIISQSTKKINSWHLKIITQAMPGGESCFHPLSFRKRESRR